MPAVEVVGAKWSHALRAGGIAVSKNVSICANDGPLPVTARVHKSASFKRNDVVAVLPERFLCNINSILDQDEYTFLPQPAEMLSACGGAGKGVGGADHELDVWYLAHFLSLNTLLHHDSWYSLLLQKMVSTRSEVEVPNKHFDDLPTVQKMKRSADFVTPPVQVMLAALQYVRHCQFFAAMEGANKNVLTVCPLLDLLLHASRVGGGGEASNLSMEYVPATGAAALDKMGQGEFVGSKQRRGNKKEETDAAFLCLRASRDLTAGEQLSLTAVSLPLRNE